MNSIQRTTIVFAIALAATGLQGCLATKVVTVPVKVAYGAGKLAVKGTAAAVRAVVPDDDKNPKEASDAPPAQEPEPRR